MPNAAVLMEVAGAKNNVLTEKKIKDFVSTEVVAHIAGMYVGVHSRHTLAWLWPSLSLSFSSRLSQRKMSITWRPPLRRLLRPPLRRLLHRLQALPQCPP